MTDRSHDEMLAAILMAGALTRSDKNMPTPTDLAHMIDDIKKAAVIVEASNYGDQA
jgi:hypothetical protein